MIAQRGTREGKKASDKVNRASIGLHLNAIRGRTTPKRCVALAGWATLTFLSVQLTGLLASHRQEKGGEE